MTRTPRPVEDDEYLTAEECARRVKMHPKNFYAYARTQPLLEQGRRPLGDGPRPRQRWLKSYFERWLQMGHERRAAS